MRIQSINQAQPAFQAQFRFEQLKNYLPAKRIKELTQTAAAVGKPTDIISLQLGSIARHNDSLNYSIAAMIDGKMYHDHNGILYFVHNQLDSAAQALTADLKRPILRIADQRLHVKPGMVELDGLGGRALVDLPK